MARATRQRRRIPHGKLLPATSIKSGMSVYHDSIWRTVWRVTGYRDSVRVVFASGIGAMCRTSASYAPRQLVPVRITVREARVKKQVA